MEYRTDANKVQHLNSRGNIGIAFMAELNPLFLACMNSPGGILFRTSQAWKAAFVVKAWPRADTVALAAFETEIIAFDVSYTMKPPLTGRKQALFDDFFNTALPLPDSSLRSLFEQVFGSKPRSRPKKKKKH